MLLCAHWGWRVALGICVGANSSCTPGVFLPHGKVRVPIFCVAARGSHQHRRPPWQRVRCTCMCMSTEGSLVSHLTSHRSRLEEAVSYEHMKSHETHHVWVADAVRLTLFFSLMSQQKSDSESCAAARCAVKITAHRCRSGDTGRATSACAWGVPTSMGRGGCLGQPRALHV